MSRSRSGSSMRALVVSSLVTSPPFFVWPPRSIHPLSQRFSRYPSASRLFELGYFQQGSL